MTEPLDTNAHPEPEHPLHGCSHTGVLPLAAESATELLTESWSQNLRAKGRRVTKQRLAVLRAVQAHPHANAEEIVTAVRQEIPTITVQSVFEPPGTPGLYETRTGDNHHHAFCIRCGKVQDVDCAIGSAPCLTPSDFHGMAIISADVLYRGVCADCQTEAEAELAKSQVQAAASVQH